MTVRVTLTMLDKTLKCTPREDYAEVHGASCMHNCGTTTFKVQGTGRRIAADDRHYEADAVCVACNKHVGLLRVSVNTLFGLREDEAVLKGRCRVY